MKKVSSLALALAFLAGIGNGQTRQTGDGGAKTGIGASPGAPVVGEKLNYEVSWADFVVAGELAIETRERDSFGGTDGFHVVARAQSVGLVRVAGYRVDDVYESYLDASTLEPFRAEKRTSHGKKREQESMSIDQKNRVVRLSDGQTVDLKATAYDLVGLLVGIRTMDFKSGKPKSFTLVDEGRLYDLQVEVEAREKISTRAGSFNCVRLATRAIGRTVSDPYKLRIFVSEDAGRVPVLITAQPRWGAVRVELTSLAGSRPAEESKKKKAP